MGLEANAQYDDEGMLGAEAEFEGGFGLDSRSGEDDGVDEREREFLAARRTDLGVQRTLDATQMYLSEIGFSPLLTAEEERYYARLALKGDEAGRRRMIESNLRLVVKISRRYLNRGLSFMELIEERISETCEFSSLITAEVTNDQRTVLASGTTRATSIDSSGKVGSGWKLVVWRSVPSSARRSTVATAHSGGRSKARATVGCWCATQPTGKPSRDADRRVESLDELVEFFAEAGRRGLAVNRYKGLGEMNPETLWETTMDPTRRTLLQVRAEDHTEADLMFTTLMGDQVEPRRKFIEDNALDVKNLDI